MSSPAVLSCRPQVQSEATKIAKETEDANFIATQVAAELEKALPALQEAEAALNVLTKKDISELKVGVVVRRAGAFHVGMAAHAHVRFLPLYRHACLSTGLCQEAGSESLCKGHCCLPIVMWAFGIACVLTPVCWHAAGVFQAPDPG
jgi:hypothetical protein